jgi:hypothetical protein
MTSMRITGLLKIVSDLLNCKTRCDDASVSSRTAREVCSEHRKGSGVMLGRVAAPAAPDEPLTVCREVCTLRTART